MPTVTQVDALLSLKVGTVDYAAQVIDGQLVLPGKGQPTLTPVASGGTPVSEAGDAENGSITGSAFKDTGTAGFWRILANARVAGTVLAYEWKEGSGASAITVAGSCTVDAATSDFAPSKIGRSPFSLALTTATVT